MVKNLRPVETFGDVRYFDITLQMSLKKIYFNVDIRNYYGYAIRNAFLWNDSLNVDKPHDLSQDIRVNNVNFKTWHFRNADFHMHPFSGSRGIYNKQVMTFFWANKIEYFRIKNRKGSLVPRELHQPTSSITEAGSIVAFELGALPGVGYVNKYKNWQYGTMLAAGPRLQMKSYTVDNPKTFVGLIGRYDVKFVFGYSIPKFYVMLHVNMDNKSVNFSGFKYKQQFYSLRLQVGFRELH